MMQGQNHFKFGGLSLALPALFLSPDSPIQLQRVQFPYLVNWKIFKNAGKLGWVDIRLASVYCMSQPLLLRVQKPISLTLQWLCRLLMFRTVRR